jgi:hypothetical protein
MVDLPLPSLNVIVPGGRVLLRLKSSMIAIRSSESACVRLTAGPPYKGWCRLKSPRSICSISWFLWRILRISASDVGALVRCVAGLYMLCTASCRLCVLSLSRLRMREHTSPVRSWNRYLLWSSLLLTKKQTLAGPSPVVVG